ncbi:hypothetical protein ACQPZQ_05840 [Pseudonocardia sp. CA-142604]|uniref:hypothetical protein n=1 Tax=Pseudonocardia sp. CA-142604 TaxID=3240024 RepID=UPI003D8C3285
MSQIDVDRLLQNPMGERAPEGADGDIVRVTDGNSTIYLTPAKYEAVNEIYLRWLLAGGRDQEVYRRS